MAIQGFSAAMLGVCAGIALITPFTGAQLPCVPDEPTASVFAPDAAFDDQFGFVIHATGDSLLVSCFPGDPRTGALPRVYRFDVSDSDGPAWRATYQPAGIGHDAFGLSIAQGGGVIAVGAAQDSDAGAGAGAVYLFDEASGAVLTKLTAADAEINDQFGNALAVQDSVLAVGAAQADDDGVTSGAVYIYNIADPASPVLVHRLRPDMPDASSDRFGASLDIDGDRVLIGTSPGSLVPGSAFLFDLCTGEQVVRYTSGLDEGADRFGSTVALSDGRAAIGAWFEINGLSVAGAVYIFEAETGALLYRLIGDDRPSDGSVQGFGYAIDLSPDYLLVGSADRDDRLGRRYAYLFDAPTGARVKTLYHPTDGSNRFGYALALQGNRAFVGDRWDDTVEINAGAVLAYDLAPDEPCIPDFAPPACVLDLADIVVFVTAFMAGDPGADLAPPFGLIDVADLSAFTGAFLAGCG